jgi:hypothetical protein
MFEDEAAKREADALRKNWHDTQGALLEWGKREIDYRKNDLKNRTEDGLKLAKRNAKVRRAAVGLDEEQAVTWMKAARKALKEESEKVAPAQADIPTTTGSVW